MTRNPKVTEEEAGVEVKPIRVMEVISGDKG